jgi:hypothetical protein
VILRRVTFFSAAAVAIVAASCQPALNSTDREGLFDELFPIEMNTRISLTQVPEFGEPRIGWAFSLLLENEADRPVWLGWDHNPREFLYSDDSDEWVEIRDSTLFSSEGEVLPAQGARAPIILLPVAPYLEPGDTPVQVRVVVVGQIMADGVPTDEEVGAFIDITIYP